MGVQRTSSFAVAALISALMIMSACNEKKERASAEDLPDLNRQMRPYRLIEDTKVRTGPGEQFRVIGDIKQNSRVQVVGRDGQWLLIVSRKGNAPGYIFMDSATPAGDERGETEPSARPVRGMYEALGNTRVRSGPGLHHPVVAEVKKGTKIYVVGEDNGWLRVESKRGNPPGYVEAALARPLPGTAKAKTN
jgi:uncharacterized protein YgiM (DUF1202 family)